MTLTEGERVSELTNFLLARIAERESAITYAYETGNLSFPILSPAEMLAECDAKRRIVKELHEAIQYDETIHEAISTTAAAGMHVLNYLALPYADHPDYREEWKP